MGAKGLKAQLFRIHSDDVSVCRGRWVAPWLAKFHARMNVQDFSIKPPKLYVGLAFLTAEKVRGCGSDVVDSRSEYMGHAHISHGYAYARGEVPPAHILKMLNDRAAAIAKAAIYEKDPVPRSLRWRGKTH